MRKIIFRGKDAETNSYWVHGYYCFTKKRRGAFGQTVSELDFDTHYIISPRGQSLKVIPETVGEFTGVVDEHGINIFEGDIVKVEEIGYVPFTKTGVVAFEEGRFGIKYSSAYQDEDIFWAFDKTGEWRDGNASGNLTYKYYVIGNKFDNPELLEHKKS